MRKLSLLLLIVTLISCIENNKHSSTNDKSGNNLQQDKIEENIIELTEHYKPTSVDMLKSLKANKELYSSLKKNYKKVSKEKVVVNNLLLKQHLYSVKTECLGGYDILWLGKQDDIIAWIVEVAISQMGREYPKEQFGVGELYYFFVENPEKVDVYDDKIMLEISKSLDSCENNFLKE